MINCDSENKEGIILKGDWEELCDDFVNIVVSMADSLENILGGSGSTGLMLDLFNFGMQQYISSFSNNVDESEDDNVEPESINDNVSH